MKLFLLYWLHLVSDRFVYTCRNSLHLPGIGRSVTEGAFRALTRGYTHWASGRMEFMEVNTHNPDYCHIRSNMKPSMKPGLYKVYFLLHKEDGVTSVEVATCECAAR